jgi:Protein of unknown function (DUF3752)
MKAEAAGATDADAASILGLELRPDATADSQPQQLSLMEEHLAKQKAEKEAAVAAGATPAFEWDREKVMGMRREATPKQRQAMLRDANQFSSRFTSGEQQNSFV